MPEYIVAKVTVEVEITIKGPDTLGSAVDKALDYMKGIADEHKIVSVLACRAH
jgi:hypothetical protein